MKVRTAASSDDANADVIASAVEALPAGELGKLLKAQGFEPKAGAARLVPLDGRLHAVAGLGEEVDGDAYRTAAGAVARAVERIGGSLAWVVDGDRVAPDEQVRAVVDGL